MNDSLDQLGFPEIRHRIVTPLELLAGQAVTVFEWRDRAGERIRSAEPPGLVRGIEIDMIGLLSAGSCDRLTIDVNRIEAAEVPLEGSAEILGISIPAEIIKAIVVGDSACEFGEFTRRADDGSNDAIEAFGPIRRGGMFLVIEAFDQPKTANDPDVELEILEASHKVFGGGPPERGPCSPFWHRFKSGVETGGVFPHPRHRKCATAVSP